jgi:hypothetical protein
MVEHWYAKPTANVNSAAELELSKWPLKRHIPSLETTISADRRVSHRRLGTGTVFDTASECDPETSDVIDSSRLCSQFATANTRKNDFLFNGGSLLG